MKHLSSFLAFAIVVLTKKNNLILCQSCQDIWNNVQTGMASYDIELEKSKLLLESGYICDNSEPFTSVLKLNERPHRNMTEIFLNSERLLRGTQKILDDYFGEQMTRPKPDIDSVKKFLNNATECVPKELRCPNEFLNIICDPMEKYRSFDGSCNNLGKPYQGAALTHYSRLDETTTFYDDNVMEPRKSITGENLISPRIIIDKLLLNTYTTEQCSNQIPNIGWLLFGQLITHDIAGSINNVHEKTMKTNDPPIRCCTQDYKNILPSSKMHSSCLPFSISPNDQYHRNTKLGCHNYIRTKTTLPNDCQLKGAQQISRVSHYPDLSVIYGSSKKKAETLRTKEDGKLLTSDGNLLPKRPNCNGGKCYYSGDFRALQVPPLGLLHLIFIRLHNTIAGNIKDHVPIWDDEKLFEDARRLTIAIYQNIIYKDYLSILLSENFDIDATYDSAVDGSTTNDFNTGVFRQLHWFTPKKFEFYGDDETISIPYGKMIFDQTDYFKNNFSTMAQTLIQQPINLGKIEDEVVNRLFNQTDLLSVDIQRGRDHGLAPYWKYREICGLKPIKSFKDLSPTISEDDIYRLARVYNSVYDIDLYVGGGLEQKNCSDIIGPTLKCLTKLQFERFKNGDRFFYTNKNFPHSFPQNVIEGIKNITFSTILCSTTNERFVPENAFLVPSSKNKLIPCSSIEIKDFIRELKFIIL